MCLRPTFVSFCSVHFVIFITHVDRDRNFERGSNLDLHAKREVQRGPALGPMLKA